MKPYGLKRFVINSDYTNGLVSIVLVRRKMKSKAQTSIKAKNMEAVKTLTNQKENLTRLKSSKLKSREKLDCLLEEKDQLIEEIRKCRAKLWLHLVCIGSV